MAPGTFAACAAKVMSPAVRSAPAATMIVSARTVNGMAPRLIAPLAPEMVTESVPPIPSMVSECDGTAKLSDSMVAASTVSQPAVVACATTVIASSPAVPLTVRSVAPEMEIGSRPT